MRIINCSRRRFLRGLAGAGALVLGGSTWPRALVASAANKANRSRPGGTAGSGTLAPDVFLSIGGDCLVTILAHRSEMGSGIRTGLPAIVADELGADWARVKVQQAIGSEKYGSQDTDGSQSIRDFFDIMRVAGATARMMLEEAAARTWGVEPTQCVAQDHQVTHHPTGRSLPFGALVATAAALPVPAKKSLRFRKAADLRYVGKDLPLVDRADIITGKAVFGMDVQLPGMKYAAIARSPVLGGTVVKYDDRACKTVAGVERVIVIPPAQPPYAFKPLGGIAVIAKDTWSAFQGRDKLEITWAPGPSASYDSSRFRATLESAVNKSGEVVRTCGDVDRAMAGTIDVHEATYYVPHLAHATMEPPVATAHVTGDHCVVWAPTQNPVGARDTVAGLLGLKKKNVTVNVTLLGGGFGRKSKADFVAEAALLSKQVAAPVKVVWSREDDVMHDYYHAVSAVHVKAALGAGGKPVAWLQRTAFPPIPSTFAAGATSPSDGELAMGFTDLPYDVPNIRCERAGAPAHVRIGWFRSVCNIYHAFAIGSFVDELAAKAKRDPLEYLLEVIGPDRHVDVIAQGAKYDNMGASLSDYPIDTARLKHVARLVAKSAGWGQRLPRGQGLGIACHRSFVSYVAIAVRVEVSKDGSLTIPRVDVVIDCGKVVNPDRVRAQMEGSAVFGTSLAMMSEITIKDGIVQQRNFNDYRVARIDEAPREIHVQIVPSDAPPAGVGEPAVPPLAPALTNAIFASTGKRIRALPISKTDLGWS